VSLNCPEKEETSKKKKICKKRAGNKMVADDFVTCNHVSNLLDHITVFSQFRQEKVDRSITS
jgi:hypothetical protein